MAGETAELVATEATHIEVVIDVDEPIEVGDFVAAFTAIAGQYKRYMIHVHPDLKDDTKLFISDVRSGSIVAALLPVAASLIGVMDQAMIIEQFVRLYGSRLGQYFKPGGRLQDTSTTELKDFINQVSAIARSKNGRGQIRAVQYEDGERKVRASIEFNAENASVAAEEIENHTNELKLVASADHERVLMVFKRSDIGDADVGVRSGERVIIESISNRDMALIYGSKLAEERIKDQMRNTEENIYHKGFVVDVNVTTKGGRPVAYSITHLHQVIDLPNDS